MACQPTNHGRGVTGVVAALLIEILAVAACTVTPADVAPMPATGRQKLDDLMASFERSSTNVEFSPKVVTAFKAFDQKNLIPTSIYGDSSIWNDIHDSTRMLSVTGTIRNNHYDVAPDTAIPVELGASLRRVRLERLSRRHFRWTSTVEQTLGSFTVQDLVRGIQAAFREAAGMTGAELREASLSRYPHAAAVLGRWLSLDSIVTKRDSLKTHVRLVVGIHMDRLASIYPSYAASLRMIAEAAQFHCVATDGSGAEWARVVLGGGRFTMEIATTRAGHLAPLTGPPRPMPDTLRLNSAVSTKISLFSVGVHDLITRFTLLDAPHVLGWRFQFQQEPKWDFPLMLEHLVSASLSQPFTGPGGLSEAWVADSTGGAALYRQLITFEVEESAIVRWLGGASAQMYGAFSDSSTVEENAFYASFLSAAREDLRTAALVGDRAR